MPASPEDVDERAIAIVGLAGRYPQAAGLGEFWANLAAGRDCVGPIPEPRRRPGWPVDIMWGGFLDGVDTFDPLLFGITPRDAALMDPQERQFLQTTWEAFEDAGYSRERLRTRHGSRVAVYAGSMYNEYPFFGVERSAAGDPTDTGSAIGGIANRVSYFYDLHGPSMTVDTMCSSSLTAINLAIRDLRQGDCEMAVAGGVNLSLHPNKFIQQRRMKLTASGLRSRSFGEGATASYPPRASASSSSNPCEPHSPTVTGYARSSAAPRWCTRAAPTATSCRARSRRAISYGGRSTTPVWTRRPSATSRRTARAPLWAIRWKSTGWYAASPRPGRNPALFASGRSSPTSGMWRRRRASPG